MNPDLEAALAEANGDGGGPIPVDFSACKDDFDNPETGSYAVKVESAKLGESKQGNPVVKLVFEVTDGSYKGKLFASLNYTGKAAWKLRKFLKALGYQVEGKTFQLDPASMVGRTAIAVVDDESKAYSSVAELRPAAAPVPNALD